MSSKDGVADNDLEADVKPHSNGNALEVIRTITRIIVDLQDS